MMRRILLALVMAMAVSHAARGAGNDTASAPPSEPPAERRVESMKIRITIGERVITAAMHDNATAND